MNKLSVESGHDVHPLGLWFIAAFHSRGRWYLLNRILRFNARRTLSTLVIERANRHNIFL